MRYRKTHSESICKGFGKVTMTVLEALEHILVHSLLVAAIGWILFYVSVRWLAAYVLEFSRRRLRKKKREEAFIPPTNQFSTCDVLPSNGINALIRHTWNFFLEPYLASEGLVILQGVLERSIEESQETTPNQVIEWLQIKELTWGISPPKLSNIALQLLFPERHLKISFTLELSSTDLHCLMDVLLRLHPSVPAVKCEVTANKLYFLANISFAFHLCNETPGFGNFEIWFEEKPTLDLKLLPLGLPISDIALVSDWLNTSIENIIEVSMVGSERVLLSMFDVYNRMKVLQEKRIIRIIVHKPLTGTGMGKGEGEDTRRYCKVKFGHRYKRTYIYDGTNASQWTCLLDFSLHEYPLKCEELLTVSLLEYQSDVAEPVEVATAKVLVSIQGGKNSVLSEEEGKAAVKVAVNYNEKARSCVAPFQGETKMSCVRLTVSALSASNMGGFRSNLKRVQSSEDFAHVKKDVLTIDSYLLTSLRWIFRPLFTFLHLEQAAAQPNYMDNYRNIMFRSSTQLVNIKKEFDKEKMELEEQLEDERMKVEMIEKELESEKRRRVNQDLRALIEGGKFLVLKISDAKYKKGVAFYVWHSSSERQIVLAYHSKASKPVKKFSLDDIEHVRNVVYINPPAPDGVDKSKRKKTDNRARSQFLLDLSNGDCYRFEIPIGGNGRSRDEWVTAFRCVVSGARIT